MTLPNRQSIVIEQAKVVDYLLNAAHPDNGGKAAFFAAWGFLASDWTTLAEAIRQMASHAEAAVAVQSPWGTKHVVDGALNAPNGTTPPVRTVWIVDGLSKGPRLVTAYPRK